jgi:cytochrome b561
MHGRDAGGGFSSTNQQVRHQAPGSSSSRPGREDKQIYALFNGTHKVLAVVFMTLIAVHVLAALKHAAIDRDGIVRRMWFARRSTA